MTETSPIMNKQEKPEPQSFAEKAALVPDQVFKDPAEVLGDARLSIAEKRKVLEVWEDSERRLIDSAEEGMTPPNPTEATVVKPRPSRLSDVQAALRQLHEQAG